MTQLALDLRPTGPLARARRRTSRAAPPPPPLPAQGPQLYLLPAVPRLVDAGEYGRCLCGRWGVEGGWGPPLLEELETGGDRVDLSRLWHCRRCVAGAWTEYARRLSLVEQYERDLGLLRAYPHRAIPARPSAATPRPHRRPR